MDYFLKHSNYLILYRWFKGQLLGYYRETSDKWALSLYQTNENYNIYIHFYKSGVIEQLIKDKHDQSVLYYIHFQFLNFSQSTALLNDFFMFLEKHNHKDIEICCS